MKPRQMRRFLAEMRGEVVPIFIEGLFRGYTVIPKVRDFLEIHSWKRARRQLRTLSRVEKASTGKRTGGAKVAAKSLN